MKNKILYLILTISIVLILLEILTRIIFGHPLNEVKKASYRIMLFEAGENFMNIDEIFTYYPNTKIRTETYYIINNILTKEYRYNLETNNLDCPKIKILFMMRILSMSCF